MKVIVAVDQNWAIGKDNHLLVRIPADMKHFKETTIGNVVVMGRKTLESFPQGNPLPHRVNIVLTRNKEYKKEGVTVCHSIEQLQEHLQSYMDKEVFVIGGESIYRQLLELCDTAYVTKIEHSYDADTFFPNLEKMEDWHVTGQSEEQTYFDLEYAYLRYEKRK